MSFPFLKSYRFCYYLDLSVISSTTQQRSMIRSTLLNLRDRRSPYTNVNIPTDDGRKTAETCFLLKNVVSFLQILTFLLLSRPSGNFRIRHVRWNCLCLGEDESKWTLCDVYHKENGPDYRSGRTHRSWELSKCLYRNWMMVSKVAVAAAAVVAPLGRCFHAHEMTYFNQSFTESSDVMGIAFTCSTFRL